MVLCCRYDIDWPLIHNINFSKLYKALGVGPPNFPPIYPVFYRTRARVSACTVDQYSTARLPARSKWAREANEVKALVEQREGLGDLAIILQISTGKGWGHPESCCNHWQVCWYEEATDTLADQSSESRHCQNLIDKMPRISDLKVISLATNMEVW